MVAPEDLASYPSLVDDGTTAPLATPDLAKANMLSTAWQKLKGLSKIDKQAVAKLGITFGLTYNVISNINDSVSMTLAWYMTSKKVSAVESSPSV